MPPGPRVLYVLGARTSHGRVRTAHRGTPGTLISTANMHLKLRNPAVAAEIYSRLLQGANVGPREREVATRKLAECEKLLQAEAP